jgi:hypothetical protein
MHTLRDLARFDQQSAETVCDQVEALFKQAEAFERAIKKAQRSRTKFVISEPDRPQ